MESLRNLLLDLGKSVQCAICLQSLKNPVTTRCDHNFCNLCITKAMSGKSHIPCPLCKKVIKTRSLKKCADLCSLIPLVHRVANQVEEEADIPYTLSQSTRELHEQVGRVTDGVSNFTQNHRAQQEPVLYNGDLTLQDDVIVAFEGNTVETEQHNPVCDFAKDKNSKVGIGSAICMTSAIFNKNEKTDHSEKSDYDGASTTDMDSHNLVTEMIVAADVHCSPLIEIESPATVQGAIEQFSSVKPGKSIEKRSKSSSKPNSMNSHKHVSTTANADVTEDLYIFPISQNVIPAKKPTKRIPRKKFGELPLKRRKASSNCEKSVPKRMKRSRRPFSDAEVAKASVQGMIAEVEKHSFTIEKVPQMIRKDPLSSKSTTAKLLKKMSADVKKKANAKRDKIHKENPPLARRLLSDSTSSSSESACERKKNLLPREYVRQQSVKEKVSNWLQTASPSALSGVGIHQPSLSPRKDKREILSGDDIVSRSQVSLERLPDRIVVLKRRKFLSPVTLDTKLQESVKNQLWSRDSAVFGSSRPKKTEPKNRKDTSCILRTDEDITDDLKKGASKKDRKGEKTVIIGKVVRKKRGASRGKETEPKTIFDVPSLSQGVAPFSTPVDKENGKDAHESALADLSNDWYSGVTQEEGKDGVEELLSASNEKGKDEKMPEYTRNDVESEGQNNLEDVVKELQSPRSGNYEIQSDNTEFVLKNGQAVKVTDQVAEMDNNDKDNATATSVKNSTQQNQELTNKSSPAKVPKHCLPPKERNDDTPTRTSRNDKLLSLGESPTGFTVSKHSQLQKAVPSSAVVELGLLDFSEPVYISNVQGNTASSTRPDAVANTCRMVMKSLGELSRVQEPTEEARQISTSAAEASEEVLKDAWGTIQMSDENPFACETDDSAIPPSTSTVNLDLPATPQKCDLRRIPPEIMETDLEGTASCTLYKEITQKEHASVELEDKTATNTTIIRNAPLPDETEFCEGVKPVGPVLTRSCELNSVVESSDNEDAGSLRCLTNGWGGTKLRIFRSTGSDTDFYASRFSKKRKISRKPGLKDRQDSFASNKQDSTGATRENTNDVWVSYDAAEKKELAEFGKENTTNCKSAITVRKSSRKNKGRHALFDYETFPYPENTNKPGTESPASTTPIEKAQSAEFLAKTSKESVKDPKNKRDGNLVLQHLREAMAEVGDWHENIIKDKPLIRKVSETKIKSKLSKIHPPKKLPVDCVRRMQTGKRTNNNTVASDRKAVSEDDAVLARSDDEKLNSSWPLEGEKTRERFFLNHSQPSNLPKHITEVSVRVLKLDEISVGNFASNLQDNGIDSAIDSSPMLFNTQDVHGGELERPEEMKDERGRSISIDLAKPTNWEERSTITETDIIQDIANIVQEDADDVVCCSWNEEEKVGTAVASCHEDDCSVASGQRVSLQSTPQRLQDHWQRKAEDTGGPENTETSIVDPTVQVAISALKEVSCINYSGFEKLIPQSTLLLNRAIDSCIQAVAAIEKEIFTKKDDSNPENDISLSNLTTALPNSSVEKVRKGAKEKAYVPESSKKRRGRPPKGKKSIPPANKSGTEIKDTASKEQRQPAKKKDPSPGEIPSTSGLQFKTRAMRRQDEAARRDAKQTKKNVAEEDTVDELQDCFSEIDDIALFGEGEMEIEACQAPADKVEQPPSNEADKVEQPVLNEDLSASVEQAMAGLQSELNDTDAGKSLKDELVVNHSEHTEVLEEMDTGDVIEATQESPKKIQSSGTDDVVAENVEAWLKKLSDLNKRKGKIQKQKIGDKWAKSKPMSGSPGMANGDLDSPKKHLDSPKKPDDGISDKAKNVITESLRGVLDDYVAKTRHTDTLSQKPKASTSPRAAVKKKELREPVSPSKAHPLVTPDRLPQLSVVVERTSIKEMQAKLLSSSTSNSEDTAKQWSLKINEPSNKATTLINNTEISDGCTHESKRNQPCIQEWLDTAQSDVMSPKKDVSPLPEMFGFVTTGLQEKDIKVVKIFANLYNGQYYPTFDVNKVTHVVVHATPQRSCDRTLKYLQGIAGKKWVVDLKWVIDSLTLGKILPEIDYEIVGDNCMKELESEGYETPQGPMKSRISYPDYRHLAGFRCVCLPPFSLITTEQTSDLLQMCGAKIASHLGDLITSDNQLEQRLIIIDAELSSNVPDYMAMGEQFGASVVSIEWVYESISRFEAQQLDDFKITGFTQDSEVAHF